MIETDYLIVGAGAVGMSFADTMLTESDASMVIVDRRMRAGGHWNDAYPFVRLHQPSAFYGVSSTELGSRRLDTIGPNKGFFELASGPELIAYFDNVMNERLLPSGRVQFLPMADVSIDWTDLPAAPFDVTAKARLGGAETTIRVRKRVVDGTYYNTTIPSTHRRKFDVADDVACVPPNQLPQKAQDHRHFVIVGGGKTAMDVGVWLLEMGVDPDAVTWIRPRDSWLINRQTTQPSMEFFDDAIGGVVRQMEAIASSDTVAELFEKLEADGLMLRIDRNVTPSMFHYATISQGEVDLLATINDVRRDRRVTSLQNGNIAFPDGEESVPPDALYIDCTATAVERRPNIPTFDGSKITLQMVRLPNPTLSAAIAAFLEVNYPDDEVRNSLCKPCPLPDTPEEWPAATLANMMNQYMWNQDKDLRRWITDCRLDGFGKMMRDIDKSDSEKVATLTKLRETIPAAVMSLQKLSGHVAA